MDSGFHNTINESERFVFLNSHGNPLIAQGTFGEVSLAFDKKEGMCRSCSNHAESTRMKVKYATIKTIRKAFVVKSSQNSINILPHTAMAWGFANDVHESIQNEPPPKYELTKEVFCEINALRILTENGHPCITPLLSVFPTPSTLHHGLSTLSLSLAFPYCPAALSDVLSQRKFSTKRHHLSLSVLRLMWQDMLSGLSHCHSHGIMHRDIKPGNFLVSQNGYIQLADFGLAKAFPTRLLKTSSVIKYSDEIISILNENLNEEAEENITSESHAIGTLHYLPPEILYGSKNFQPSGDVFSLALVFVECLSLSPLIRGVNTLDQLSKMFRIFGTPGLNSHWPEAQSLPDFQKIEFPFWERPNDLLTIIPRLKEDLRQVDNSNQISLLHELFKAMLELDPMKRPSARDCLEHSWFFNGNHVQQPWVENRSFLLSELVEKEWMEPDIICLSMWNGKNDDEWNEAINEALEMVKLRREASGKYNGDWGGGVLRTVGQKNNDVIKPKTIQRKRRSIGLKDLIQN